MMKFLFLFFRFLRFSKSIIFCRYKTHIFSFEIEKINNENFSQSKKLPEYFDALF